VSSGRSHLLLVGFVRSGSAATNTSQNSAHTSSRDLAILPFRADAVECVPISRPQTSLCESADSPSCGFS